MKQIRKIILSSLACTSFSLATALSLSNNSANLSKTLFAVETHDHGSFIPWGEGAGEDVSLPSVEGSYYLSNDITLNSSWVAPSGVTNLCLNGHVINANGGNFSAIMIISGSTLNLYDCGSTIHYFEKNDSDLWTLASDQSIPTEYFVEGGCITGVRSETEGTTGGIDCESGGVFNLYGGNIVGNKAEKGAGVYNSSNFYMYGGKIIGNLATSQGGGVYSTVLGGTALSSGIITANKAAEGSGLYQKYEECFAAGTLITMPDGSREAIENLSIGDEVRVFDHNEGEISTARLFDLWKYPEKHSGVMDLHFTNDIDLSVVYGHSFFEREENKYVSVTKDTVSRYVGHEFYNVDEQRWETLLGYDFIDGAVDTYVITSEYHLNCVANGMLSNEDGFYTILTNIFDFDENLKIDQEKKALDIAKYGLYSYDNFKHMSKETYDIVGGQYLSVAFGKGLTTESYFKSVESYYADVDPDLFCDVIEEPKDITRAPKHIKRSLDPVSPPTKGLYVGGSIQITGNIDDNLKLDSAGFVTLGTGTVGNGNGVVAPGEEMLIGITLNDGAGQFSTVGADNYSSKFFSDSEDYLVKFNNAGTKDDSGDDFLELVNLYKITNNVKKDDQDTNNGYIEVATNAAKNDQVTLTVVSNEHCMLTKDSLIVSYNDGEDKTVELTAGKNNKYTFTMPEFEVSISASFKQKAEEQIILNLDEKFFYPNKPYVYEKSQFVNRNCYEKLGDGKVTVEYKQRGAADSEYTTIVPSAEGEYTLRVSVAEGSEHLATSITKDFVIDCGRVNKVGFNDITQIPTIGEVATTSLTGIPMGSKYRGTLTWSPELVDGKFDCNTAYSAVVTLEMNTASIDNYKFAEDVELVRPLEGWTKSGDSTGTKLIYIKSFEKTPQHVFTNVPSNLSTCTVDGYKEAYYCSTCNQYFEDCLGEHRIGDLTAYEAWKLGEGKIAASHVVNLVAGIEPTTESSGYKEAWKCSFCGEYFEDQACTKLIGDETAYNAWKSNGGYLAQLPNESSDANNTSLIVGLCIGLLILLLLIIYLLGYFFLYRKGKLDDKKIRVIYKILPRGEENLDEDEKSSKSK